jgi:protein phosphatase
MEVHAMKDLMAERPRLFILVGIPGSGKSTWARTFFDPRSIISSDEIRKQKWPGEDYQYERNEETFAEFYRRIGDMLEEGRLVVADTTGLTQGFRWKLHDLAAYYDAETHLIFFNNLEQALGRNASRKGNERVPDEAQRIMLARYKEARSAILDELYTSTTIIGATT